jgi:hypothetical protein
VTSHIMEGLPGVFVVHRGFLGKGVVVGRWFHPQRFPNGAGLEAAINEFFTQVLPARHMRSPRGANARTWKVLEHNSLDHRLVTRGGTDVVVDHAKACLRYGLSAVRAYFEVFGDWPTVGAMKAQFLIYHPQVLPWIAQYLRRRKEMGRHRRPLKSPDGRAWLLRQARRVLSRDHAVYLSLMGEVWLFRKPGQETRGKAVAGKAGKECT